MQTRRALLTGASAAAAMAVAGALTPAEGARAALPAPSGNPVSRALSDNLDAYLAELLREQPIVFYVDEAAPLRRITINSERYGAAIEEMIADMNARLPGDAG